MHAPWGDKCHHPGLGPIHFIPEVVGLQVSRRELLASGGQARHREQQRRVDRAQHGVWGVSGRFVNE